MCKLSAKSRQCKCILKVDLHYGNYRSKPVPFVAEKNISTLKKALA